ncbi:MAG: hypothetical protein AB7W59_17960 [Acidimicrobiia bacterium]
MPAPALPHGPMRTTPDSPTGDNPAGDAPDLDAESDGDAQLEAQIVALYAGPPERFVADRTALVKQLRAAKRRQEANLVAKLARPSVAAWAADTAVRADPRLLDALTAAGRVLLDAQAAALGAAATGTGADALRRAVAERRRAVQALADAALATLRREGRPAPAARDELWTIAEAVSLDPAAADQLRRGRLARTPEVPAGFELLSGFAVPLQPSNDAGAGSAVPEAPGGPEAPGTATAAATAQVEAQRRRRREEAIAARRAALAALDDADRAAAQAEAAVAKAQRIVQELTERLDAARRSADDADDALEVARLDRTRAQQALDDATRTIEDLGGPAEPDAPGATDASAR